MKQPLSLSSKATCNTHGQDSSYFLGWQEYEKDPYDEIHNQGGIIQMGLAENQLSFDLLESWLSENPNVAGFKGNHGELIFRELALFQDYHGRLSFKQAMVKFMAELRGNKVSFDPSKLVLTAGATSANETLMFCLAEKGDAILVPTPYYPGFDRDLKWRTGAEIVPIHCTSSNRFKVTSSALEQAYREAHSLDLNVKAVLVTNPSNPLGTTMTRKELSLLMDFVIDKEIHLVSDEIYSGTVFGPPSFVSIMEVLDERKYDGHDVWDRVHVVYSLSKDLGLPGFRVGAIYSNNEYVVAAATKMSSFGLVSSQTQHFLSVLLSDDKFTCNYIEENKQRLKLRHSLLVSGLSSAGICCLESNSGLFCWVDMRHLLSSNTFEAEMELWRKIVFRVKLNISPGSSCHCTEPGWFRLCFANMSEATLDVAMRRIKEFVAEIVVTRPGNPASNNQRPSHSRPLTSFRSPLSKKSLAKWVFRLSLHDGRER
ncbi:hypothetical protein MLD38_009282 [Melastoma candidum]|uniref:Uncharacterized protein n=1 Tax=Melastoma candidum TaxID=119954 RepID=A0ACB9RYC9_9MYRT|nr:hypothetical protein MLD38_009282 [Melastoma candidum]